MAAPKKTTTKPKDAVEVVRNDVHDDPQDEVITIEKDTEKKREAGIDDGVYTEYDVKLSTGVTLPEVHVVVDPDRFPMDFDSLADRGRLDLAMQLLLSDQTVYLLRALGANRKIFREDMLPVIQRGLELSRREK